MLWNHGGVQDARRLHESVRISARTVVETGKRIAIRPTRHLPDREHPRIGRQATRETPGMRRLHGTHGNNGTSHRSRQDRIGHQIVPDRIHEIPNPRRRNTRAKGKEKERPNRSLPGSALLPLHQYSQFSHLWLENNLKREHFAQILDWGSTQECGCTTHRSAECHSGSQHPFNPDEYGTNGESRERTWKSQTKATTSIRCKTPIACCLEGLFGGGGHKMGRFCGRLHQRRRSVGATDRDCQGAYGTSETTPQLFQGRCWSRRSTDTDRLIRRRAERDRSQRRKGDGDCQARASQHGPDTQQPPTTSKSACGIRSKGRKKTQKGRAARGRQGCTPRGWRCIYGYAVIVNLGRCDVTEVYTQPGQSECGALKWLHSVTECDDFKSPWGAAWNAIIDAGVWSNNEQVERPIQSLAHRDGDPLRSCLRNVSAQQIQKPRNSTTFANEIDLHAGDEEESCTWFTLCISDEILRNWPQKPWKLTFSQGGEAPLSELAVSSPPGRALGLFQDERTTSNPFDLEEPDLASFMQRGRQDSANVPVTWPCGEMTEEERQTELQRLQALICQSVDPGTIQGIPSFASSSHSQAFTTAQVSPIATPIPQALRNLQIHLRQTGTTHNADQPLRLVTWYLHHRRHRRCSRWRIVDLHRDPCRWARQITRKWSDITVPDEAYQFIAVRPDPPEIPAEGVLSTHVILQQSEHAHERSPFQ